MQGRLNTSPLQVVFFLIRIVCASSDNLQRSHHDRTSLHVEISPQGSFSDKGLMRRDQTLDVAMSNPSDGNATEQILADPEGKEGVSLAEVGTLVWGKVNQGILYEDEFYDMSSWGGRRRRRWFRRRRRLYTGRLTRGPRGPPGYPGKMGPDEDGRRRRDHSDGRRRRRYQGDGRDRRRRHNLKYFEFRRRRWKEARRRIPNGAVIFRRRYVRFKPSENIPFRRRYLFYFRRRDFKFRRRYLGKVKGFINKKSSLTELKIFLDEDQKNNPSEYPVPVNLAKEIGTTKAATSLTSNQANRHELPHQRGPPGQDILHEHEQESE